MSEIIFKNVSKYFQEKIALENVTFSIEKGEFVFITGKSGAGKSIMLKLMLRQETVSSGEIWVAGENLNQISQKKLAYYRRQIGYVSTDLGLLSDRNIYDNLELAMVAAEKSRRNAKREIARVLGMVGLSEKSQSYVYELSGGEVARILLARALLAKPRILIADEPTANMDDDSAWDVMLLLKELNHSGMTVIVASHSRELVSIMKQRVLTLVSGVLVADEKNAIYNQKAMDIFEERKILEKRSKSINFL